MPTITELSAYLRTMHQTVDGLNDDFDSFTKDYTGHKEALLEVHLGLMNLLSDLNVACDMVKEPSIVTVDRILLSKYGVTHDCLPDYCWEDVLKYDTPEIAVEAFEEEVLGVDPR